LRPDRLQSFAILGVTIAALGAIPAANEIVQYFLVIIALLSFLGFMWALGGIPMQGKALRCMACLQEMPWLLYWHVYVGYYRAGS